MRLLLTLSALAAALAAAPAAATTAGRFAPPPVIPHGPGAPQALWRDHGGDHDGWRRGHRHDVFGLIGGFGGEAIGPGPAPAPSPFVVAAPVFVNVTFGPAARPQPGSADGPKLIEIGRPAPSRGRLPLIVYGD